MSVGKEEAYVLRVEDGALAARLRAVLQDDGRASAQVQADKRMDVKFASDRQGTLNVGGDAFPLVVQDLPAVVEGWKSMDDTNLVKSLDVGQVMVVKPQGTMDLDVPREARDGVGPPMKDCRRRHFRQLPEVPPEVATEVEGDMIEILARGAADPETYEDIEEEWVEGPEGQPGYWQRVFRADV